MPESSFRADNPQIRASILAALRQLHAQGERPTARELAEKANIGHGTARRYVEALISEGIVRTEDVPSHRVRRQIVLIERGETPPDPPDEGAQP